MLSKSGGLHTTRLRMYGLGGWFGIAHVIVLIVDIDYQAPVTWLCGLKANSAQTIAFKHRMKI
ncbi:hypothetical protein BKA69DRAFT_1103315 [Paraphysoderma sedebokerense]|nr:hypothetical protein BKA69DRAFT_1103315 [Paraphysoderma sedebokerense]